ncbi:MAG: pilus (MSHA type) biogenesis protein MshL [Thermodesulfovibrionales bacterium]|nr:pilus (MSHA type) biogenesis protein MshL [Thermodesulfovibrionales bacterium]
MIRLPCILCSLCLVILTLHLYEGAGFIAVAASQPPPPEPVAVQGPPEPVAVQGPPNFIPVSEELLPLKTRIVSISARDTPLRDVLHVIAEATGLNLVMEKGVNPEIPLTVTLRHISAEDALNIIVASVDYFYSVKENILTVKAMDTRVFEFGQPPVIQDYAVDVGGDILGGAAGVTGATGIKGSVTQKLESDKTSFKLWDSIEKAIAGLPGIASFSVNRMTGTIIVTATKKDLERVENYLAAIKKALNRQVIIEARIVEVQLSESLRYGIDWTAVLEKSGLGRVTVGTEEFATVVTEALSNFHIGITGRDFTALLKALQTQGNVRVLSNPRVNIMNGQTSLLNVGRNVNFISRVETTTTTAATGVLPTTTFTVETSGILSGIIIGIVPYISDTGEITMAITPIVSDLIRLEDKTLGKVGENIIQISLPTVDLRQLSTTVRVKDGEMVIIGGLMQKKEVLEDSKVPLLGDIPLIGYLFKSRKRLDEKTELVIMLKPTIVTP